MFSTISLHFKKTIFFLAVIVFAWIILGKFGLLPVGDFPYIPGDKWQAVFLENNQVYFGKLSNFNDEYVSLENVYYLRAADSLVGDSQSINLVKLGGEFHGPENMMYIPKGKILFWENLSPSSSVVKTILSVKK